MILKITKTNHYRGEKQGKTEYVEEFYESKSFTFRNGNAIPFEQDMFIPITDYEYIDEMTGDAIPCKIISVYLMNAEGKTIERINMM